MYNICPLYNTLVPDLKITFVPHTITAEPSSCDACMKLAPKILETGHVNF